MTPRCLLNPWRFTQHKIKIPRISDVTIHKLPTRTTTVGIFMSKIVVKTSSCSGHGKFPSRQPGEAVDFFTVNGIGVLVQGNDYTSHSDGKPLMKARRYLHAHGSLSTVCLLSVRETLCFVVQRLPVVTNWCSGQQNLAGTNRNS